MKRHKTNAESSARLLDLFMVGIQEQMDQGAELMRLLQNRL